MDARFHDLARGLVEFSMGVREGERVLIDAGAVPEAMVLALMRAVRKAGGAAFVNWRRARTGTEFVRTGSAADFEAQAAVEMLQMEQMQCYVALRGAENNFEWEDVPAAQQNLFFQKMKPVHDRRVAKTKWVVLRWPTPSMAQAARMSTEAFEDFFFRVCTLDYARMGPGMAALVELMERTDRVRILSPGTDLNFSTRSIGAVACGGKLNIPDGEVFTAPVRESVEGVISYNTPSIYHGQCFENVRLVFRQGRIVEATANRSDRLNAILDSDPGARYVGEFALGFNPHILQPICDTLFDEKIAGSLHFTPGQAYANEADNGNRSQVHWDLVLIQRPEFGGGEIYFDGQLIRKDGLFTLPGIDQLNPDFLMNGAR
jgi:aminopeptidase